jgi:DNA-binding protein YbaB
VIVVGGKVTMDDRTLRQMLGEAQQTAWQFERAGLTGAGRDDTGVVRVEVDADDRLQRVEIEASWRRDVGTDRLAAAVQAAYQAACADRVAAWAERSGTRAGGTPPGEMTSDPLRDHQLSAYTPGLEAQLAELTRIVDAVRDARAELTRYEQGLEHQGSQRVIGGAEDRVTVTLLQGRIIELEMSRRWLNEEPTGRSIAHAVQDACADAHRRGGLRAADTPAATPSLAEFTAYAADPIRLFRALGVVE